MSPLRPRDYAVAAALFALGLAIWTAGFTTGAFANPDAWDYAQMGRELARGHGFSTLQIFPRHLPTLESLGALDGKPFPNLHRYPLPTIVTAAALQGTDDPIAASVFACGVFYAAGILLVFLLARHLLPLLPAALVAILHAGTPNVVKSGYDGMTEALALVLLLVAVLLETSGTPRPRRWVLLGITLGLGLLARTSLVILFPLAFVAVARREERGRRLRGAALVLLGAVVAYGPWAARNLAWTGSPTFSFSNSRNLVLDVGDRPTDLDMELHAPVATADVLDRHAPEIRAKFFRNLFRPLVSASFWPQAFGSTWPLVLLVGVALFTRPFRASSAFRELGAPALLLFVANVVVCAFAFHTDRFYVPLYPLVTILAVGAVWSLVGSSPRVRAAAGVVALLLAILQWGYAWRVYAGRTRLQPEGDAPYAALRAEGAPGDLVASDVSFRTALLADRRSLRLPAHPEELLEIDARYVRVEHVLVTGATLAGGGSRDGRFAGYEGYAAFVRSAPFLERWEPAATYSDGTLRFRRRELTPGGASGR